MCGITGFLNATRAHSGDAMKRIVLHMADTLRHRGPDDGGAWADPDAGVALGMRRLAILDLSPAGHQPMQSASGRYEIVFNGEIYNSPELRRELAAGDATLLFRGHSDTEVMLAAFDRWGPDKAVSRFNGMFAFALWDRQQRKLTLGRDRFGEKPLYYAVLGGTLLFGSELRALRAHPEFSGEIDLGAVALYLRHNCVPAPHSIYTTVRKLPPATLLTVSTQDLACEPRTYWSARDAAEAGVRNVYPGSEDEAVDELDSLLRDAVKLRMQADVPLGAFLSGGVDSSVVTALMQAQSTAAVQTFSIGQMDREFDEAPEAARVAHHLGTDHTELYVSSEDALSVVPRLPQIYDEPFADSSQIPTFLVAQLARKKVTVSLSGDGGDEVFGGYNRHTWGGHVWGKLETVPLPLRRTCASAILALSSDAWDALFHRAGPVLPNSWRQRMPGVKLYKLASIMDSRNPRDMYRRLTEHWSDPSQILPGFVEPPTPLVHGASSGLASATEEMMYLDSVTYLPDDILVKLDRATMAASLEGRIPLLDHRIFEFAWRLPLPMRVQGREGKRVLRQVLSRYVPRELVERPKLGFGIPLASWLRGPLRPWAEEFLDEGRLRREGFFNPRPIRRAWQELLAGRGTWEFQLWDVLMFEAWLEESRSEERVPLVPASSYEVRASRGDA